MLEDNYCVVYLRDFVDESDNYPSFNERAEKIDEFLTRTAMSYPLGGYFVDNFNKGEFRFDACLELARDYGIRRIVCYNIMEAYGKPLLTAKLLNRLYAEHMNVYQVCIDDKCPGIDGWILDENGNVTDSCRMVYIASMELDKCQRVWKAEEFFDKHYGLIEDLRGLDLSSEVRLNVSLMAKKHNVSSGTVNKAIKLLKNGILYE